MRRILVCGITGAGKTTFARELAARLSLPYHELDAMYHGPNWQPISTFEQDVAALIQGESWVFDSHGYSAVRDAMWARADTAIWLDYSRPTVLRRVLTRSFARAWDRQPIFNGNTESFRDWRDPEHPVQWSMSQFKGRRSDMLQRFAAPDYESLRRVRLTRPRAADLWLRVVTTPASAGDRSR